MSLDGLYDAGRGSSRPHRKEITLRQIPIKLHKTQFAISVDNVLTPAECSALIAATEETGYSPALINVGNGRQVHEPDVRNSLRCIIDDPAFASELWSRISHCLPPAHPFISGYTSKPRPFGPVQVNERMRFLKYSAGDFFATHRDGQYHRPHGHPLEGDVSLITLLINLNADYEGCSTRFYGDRETVYEAQPGVGRCLLHSHNILHEATPLTAGYKYILRTDIMCRDLSSQAAESAVE